MIEQPSHRNLLLVASRQGVPPFLARVQPAFLFHQVQHVQLFKDDMQILVSLARRKELLLTLRVDELISESTGGKVGPLRDICELSR